MDRLHGAFTLDSSKKPKKFKHHKVERMSKLKRDETLTKNMQKWFREDRNTQADDAEKSISPIKH
jgi:hypothetical protein